MPCACVLLSRQRLAAAVVRHWLCAHIRHCRSCCCCCCCCCNDHTYAVLHPQDTYAELLVQLQEAPHQMTAAEYAAAAARHGLVSLLAGRLAALLAAGVKAAFIPDMASQHIEQAKTVLVRLLHAKWLSCHTDCHTDCHTGCHTDCQTACHTDCPTSNCRATITPGAAGGAQ